MSAIRYAHMWPERREEKKSQLSPIHHMNQQTPFSAENEAPTELNNDTVSLARINRLLQKNNLSIDTEWKGDIYCVS